MDIDEERKEQSPYVIDGVSLDHLLAYQKHSVEPVYNFSLDTQIFAPDTTLGIMNMCSVVDYTHEELYERRRPQYLAINEEDGNYTKRVRPC